MHTDFDLQPTLTGSMIQLRPLRKEDFAKLYQSASDPKVWKQHPENNRYEKTVFQKFFDGALKSGGAFAIVDLVTDEIIGSSRYYGLNTENRQITVGYTFLKTTHWGGKFNRELKTLMLSHAFKFVDLVTFEIGTKNLRSRKAIEKIGANLLRTENFDDSPHVIYSIDRTGFIEALG